MNIKIRLVALVGLIGLSGIAGSAQTRPRRAKPTTTSTTTGSTAQTKPDNTLLTPVPTDKAGQPAAGSSTRSRTVSGTTGNTGGNTAGTNRTAPPADRPLITPRPSPNAPTTAANNSGATNPGTARPAGPDITRGTTLFNQGNFAEALKEAKALIAADPTKSDYWKLAGLSELNLQKYPDAVKDLEKAKQIQTSTDHVDDKTTNDGLAMAYGQSEQFDKALPYLVTATTRAGEAPNAGLLQMRGLAEFKTGKPDAAVQSFTAASKANPKDMVSLFYLGRIAFEKKDYAGAIANFNRVTTGNPTDAAGWKYLTYAYFQRALSTTDPAKAEPDYLGAVRASEALVKLTPDDDSQLLRGQTLYYAKQYPQAIVVLEKVAVNPNVKGEALLLLGTAYLQTKNNPKMITTLEKAAVKLPTNVDVFRYLGYGYEVDKQYAKALTAYQKASQLAPNDTTLKDSVERVRPFAK
jgi:tetratricopeptide (TPR) repeat protein